MKLNVNGVPISLDHDDHELRLDINEILLRRLLSPDELAGLLRNRKKRAKPAAPRPQTPEMQTRVARPTTPVQAARPATPQAPQDTPTPSDRQPSRQVRHDEQERPEGVRPQPPPYPLVYAPAPVVPSVPVEAPAAPSVPVQVEVQSVCSFLQDISGDIPPSGSEMMSERGDAEAEPFIFENFPAPLDEYTDLAETIEAAWSDGASYQDLADTSPAPQPTQAPRRQGVKREHPRCPALIKSGDKKGLQCQYSTRQYTELCAMHNQCIGCNARCKDDWPKCERCDPDAPRPPMKRACQKCHRIRRRNNDIYCTSCAKEMEAQ